MALLKGIDGAAKTLGLEPFVSEYLPDEYLPMCGVCEKRVQDVKVIAGFKTPAQLIIHCHDTVYAESVGYTISRNREEMYRYLERLKDRTFFITEANQRRRRAMRDALAATRQLEGRVIRDLDRDLYEVEIAGLNTTMTAEQIDALKINLIQSYIANGDPPRSYQVQNQAPRYTIGDRMPEPSKVQAKSVPALPAVTKARAIRIEDE